jgi:hypothetical protein
MAVDSTARPQFDQTDGDAALYALAEWSTAQAPQRLRHQAQQVRDAMAAAGELPPHAAPPSMRDTLSADG